MSASEPAPRRLRRPRRQSLLHRQPRPNRSGPERPRPRCERESPVMTSLLDPAQFDAPELLLRAEQTLLDDGLQPGQAVVVADGRFGDVGPAAEVRRRHPQAREVELAGHLMMPGFVDAHHHLTQSFGKSLAYGEPSEIFSRIWVPLEASLDDEFVYLAGKLAALESLRGGFTTVCDAGT